MLTVRVVKWLKKYLEFMNIYSFGVKLFDLLFSYKSILSVIFLSNFFNSEIPNLKLLLSKLIA